MNWIAVFAGLEHKHVVILMEQMPVSIHVEQIRHFAQSMVPSPQMDSTVGKTTYIFMANGFDDAVRRLMDLPAIFQNSLVSLASESGKTANQLLEETR